MAVASFSRAAGLLGQCVQFGAPSNRGALFLKLGQPEPALEDHLRFVSLDPRKPIGHRNCAEAYTALHMDRESLAACDAAVALDRNYVGAHIIRGLMLSGLGRFKEAGAAFEIVKGLDLLEFRAHSKTRDIDYRITDRCASPPGQEQYYSEKFV